MCHEGSMLDLFSIQHLLHCICVPFGVIIILHDSTGFIYLTVNHHFMRSSWNKQKIVLTLNTIDACEINIVDIGCWYVVQVQSFTGAFPGWSGGGGGVEAKIGRKWANFARFWPILGGGSTPRPLLDPPLIYNCKILYQELTLHVCLFHPLI